MKLLLKRQYISEKAEILEMLQGRGWNVVATNTEGVFVLDEQDPEDQEDFKRYYCGEDSWSPTSPLPGTPWCRNVKYFDEYFDCV